MFGYLKNKIKHIFLAETIQIFNEELTRLKQKNNLLFDVIRSDDNLKTTLWLLENGEERMDASREIFGIVRRNFHISRYIFAAQYSRGKVVADIACGTGYGTEILAVQGEAKDVYGVDIASDAVEYARQKHAALQITYLVASGADTGLPGGAFDLVVSFETIEHLEDDDGLMAEFDRLLKPGGKLICSTPNQWPLAVATHHVREYDYNSFVQLLGKRFSIDAVYNQNSGCEIPFNHGQEAGILETDDFNKDLAECFIAVCTKDA